ncbi:MAPEG family protein [Henriciella aquimarina]|uniref:MAPEG family protein n=1 Tax=Henriciella aquimarina TaxID=545261 RepID=UPI0009FFA8F0|nr:MAPEG family protein [Henriciella aquimarina]
MPFQTEDLLPVLALVVWTLIMWIWMYVTRIPAFQKAGVTPAEARHPDAGYNEKIPSNIRAIADNYNHLHEQPTIFYALVFFAALTGGGDNLFMYLAWAYVISRVIHSFIQILSSKVEQRFLVFAIGTIILMVMAGKEVVRILTNPALTG